MYDAAGNITASNQGVENSQVSKFNAVGRRTRMVDAWNNQNPTSPHLPRVFEQLIEHQFDGDGNPVKEGTGNRQANVPDPPPLVVSGYAHQLWSTVLGRSLI